MVGLEALRQVLEPGDPSATPTAPAPAQPDIPSLKDLIDSLTASETGLVMVMGKGGVGKTTVAAAIAVGMDWELKNAVNKEKNPKKKSTNASRWLRNSSVLSANSSAINALPASRPTQVP